MLDKILESLKNNEYKIIDNQGFSINNILIEKLEQIKNENQQKVDILNKQLKEEKNTSAELVSLIDAMRYEDPKIDELNLQIDKLKKELLKYAIRISEQNKEILKWKQHKETDSKTIQELQRQIDNLKMEFFKQSKDELMEKYCEDIKQISTDGQYYLKELENKDKEIERITKCFNAISKNCTYSELVQLILEHNEQANNKAIDILNGQVEFLEQQLKDECSEHLEFCQIASNKIKKLEKENEELKRGIINEE